MEIIIGILIIMVGILGYTTYNLLKKNEKQEDILLSYNDYLNKISDIIELSDLKIKQIDDKKLFESDDEIGFFFEQIKQIQGILSQFNIKKL